MAMIRPVLVMLVLLLGLAQAALAGTAISYRFERLWPSLQQPWYFVNTRGIAIDPQNNVIVVDSFNHRVHRFSREGQLISRFGQFGADDGQFMFPLVATTTADGDIFVAETDEGGFRRIQKFSGEGEHLLSFGGFGAGPGQFGQFGGFTQLSPWDMVVDDEGNLLVTGDNRVQKFDPQGNYLSEFGSGGANPTAPGEFEFLTGIALDSQGRIYLADGGTPNEIQVFDAGGAFITRFGSSGPNPGEFRLINDLEVIREGPGVERLLVADAVNNRVQKLELDGTPVAQWGQGGTGPGEFQLLWRIGVDSAGLVYTVDANSTSDFGIHRVQKFTADGTFLSQWTSGGVAERRLQSPFGIHVDRLGRVFVADSANHRIKVYSATGSLMDQWGALGSGTEQFNEPVDVDIGPDGLVYVMDFGNQRVQVFTDVGDHVRQIGAPGTGPDQFEFATDLAIDRAGDVYVVNALSPDDDGFVNSSRVQKFSAQGTLLDAFFGGCFDSNDRPTQCLFRPDFDSPRDIAVDTSGSQDIIWVADHFNLRLQAFTAGGDAVEIRNLDSNPESVAVDPNGNVYVIPFSDTRSDTGHFVAQVGNGGNKISFFGEFGSNPGQLRSPGGLAFAPDGRAYVADSLNNRIQVFVPAAQGANNRAIVVTGGGPYPGNALWPATQLNANFAYRALVQQGFVKGTIEYLSADTDLDLDQNGQADDVDADATNANFQNAITGDFAAGADSLTVYMVDHGGLDTFRMSGSEILDASTLDGWLNAWQTANPGARVTVIYDACQSGSFVDELQSDVFDRVVIASSGADENAYFVSQGTLSFSSSFWTHVFNGLTVEQSYLLARDATSTAFPAQNPLLESNGDGTADTPEDLARVAASFIGNGTDVSADAPTIASVSAAQTVASGNSATLDAVGVTDPDGVARVWAVLRPPGFNPGSPDNPVQDLPTFDLEPLGGSDDYQETFNGFAEVGTYQVSIYALDNLGNTSLPRVTSVTVDNPLDRRAIIIGGGQPGDTLFDALAVNTDLAYRALDQQGYGTAQASCGVISSVCDLVCDNVCYLSAAGGAGSDAAPTLANITDAIASWGTGGVQDLTIYLAAEPDGPDYRLTAAESLEAGALDGLLDTAQATIPGTVSVVVDGDGAGGFIRQLAPPTSSRRVLVGSADTGETAAFLLGGNLSFSRFFWNQVLNGASLRDAFNLARTAVAFSARGQTPQLDDNGNASPNELFDGAYSQGYSIGSGVLLAGDDPLVDSVQVNAVINGFLEPITVVGVTTTGTIDSVVAVITQPGGNLVTETLTQDDGLYRARVQGLCAGTGEYTVAAYAIDGDGNTSLPATTTANRSLDCSEYIFVSGFEQ